MHKSSSSWENSSILPLDTILCPKVSPRCASSCQIFVCTAKQVISFKFPFTDDNPILVQVHVQGVRGEVQVPHQRLPPGPQGRVQVGHGQDLPGGPREGRLPAGQDEGVCQGRPRPVPRAGEGQGPDQEDPRSPEVHQGMVPQEKVPQGEHVPTPAPPPPGGSVSQRVNNNFEGIKRAQGSMDWPK